LRTTLNKEKNKSITFAEAQRILKEIVEKNIGKKGEESSINKSSPFKYVDFLGLNIWNIFFFRIMMKLKKK